MISPEGVPSVVSTNSTLYADLLQIGTYTDHFTGTKRECEEEKESLLSDLVDVD